TVARDNGHPAGPLPVLEVRRRVPDGDLPDARWQLRLLEAHPGAGAHRRGREQLDKIDGLDSLRPRLEIAEHVPHALLRRVNVDGLRKPHGRSPRRSASHPGDRQRISLHEAPPGGTRRAVGRATDEYGLPACVAERRWLVMWSTGLTCRRGRACVWF